MGSPSVCPRASGFVQVQNRDQLLAGVDAAGAVTLIFKATREVKAHPAVVLALICVCRWATQGTARIDH